MPPPRSASLLRFEKDSLTPQPKVLVVAPMSGHFATLLRPTVQTMLADFDVYITDWQNARDVPAYRPGGSAWTNMPTTLIRLPGAAGTGHAICWQSASPRCLP